MKKYTIKDNKGNKKTIYAENITHALTFADSKAGGFDYPDNKNEADITWNNGLYIGKKAGYNRYAVSKKSGSKYLAWGVYSPKELDKLHLTEDSIKDDAVTDMGQHAPAAIVPAHQTYNPEYSIQQFKSYIHNIIKDLYGNDYNRETVRAISKLNTYASQVIDDFKADIKNSDLDKRKTVQYYTQYVDALYKEITDVVNIRNIDGESLRKIDDIHAEMARSIHDSVKVADEASLAASINALVTDEKAAIDAYNVAISNLKGKIDDNAMQVLINIMKDERKHVENLYAILNNQVTEKNLEDSIKDSVKDFATKDTDSSIGIIFNKLYNSDYDNFDEIKRDFDRLKSKLTNAEKEKIYKEISFASGMALSSVKQRLEDSIKDAFIVKADNEYIMEGDRPEMTSFRKYAKQFNSEKEAIDYAKKVFQNKTFRY